MDEIKEKAKKDSFYIALSYVGLGTISLLAMTSKTLMENDFTSVLFLVTSLLTIPVSFLGFGILWGGGEDGRLLMFLVQAGVFVLFWYLTFRYFLRRNRNSEPRITKTMDGTGTDAQQKL